MVPVSLAELVLSGLIRLLKITISSFQLRISVAKWADIKEYTPPEAPRYISKYKQELYIRKLMSAVIFFRIGNF